MDQCGGVPRESNEELTRQFRELTDNFMVPHRNECIICFLMRAMAFLAPSGFALTAIYRNHNAPRATNLGGRLARLGVYGDCQLIQSGVVMNLAIWDADRCPDCGIPEVVPDCLEVRRGSTQPCKLWRWRRDVAIEMFQEWQDRVY
ncbi:hypothetical protein MB46_16535 [Arthrobacter alpinus]|uniref:hypothetical protein n=1 Tax=Arthrobacter alpinus TaxID=656366 RepID=UPI0005C873C0|nr:hypothetical protein [Arthrobacter alpinus]ALV46854.1 hypothetical protein MB46_16535 [Arthrobacter alpinus]